MISADQRAACQRDGFIVVPDRLSTDELAEIRHVVATRVAASAEVESHTDIDDLEPGHTRSAPLPPAERQGSIYENVARRSYFQKATV